MVYGLVNYEHPRDRKVSEAGLTVPSNQDVVLDTPSISVGVYSIPHLPTGLILPCEISDP